ncbi:MAG: carbonic anhydrase [Crocinitomicaceae bacterium]|jgi:carbonic anhydrase
MGVIYTCNEGLEKLKEGNRGHIHRMETQGGRESYQIGTTEEGQEPYAAILSCADSRVIPECIFTANAGDLFVVRVAGNVANVSSVASLEYAVKYLHIRIIVVLGHESCGAVDSTIKQAKDRLNLGANLNQLLSNIIPAVNTEIPTDDLVEATCNNAEIAAKRLIEQSEILQEYFDKGELGVVHGYYQVYGPKAGHIKGIINWKCPKC